MTGIIALFGSGETSRQGRQVHELLLNRLPKPPTVAVLETPAGFQPNVDNVTGRIRTFFEQRLQNYRPKVVVVQARRRDGPFDADALDTVVPLNNADLIFAGPGSPTYAARVLAGSRTLTEIAARVRAGTTLSLASAAAIAFGRYALPVYEIFKVGDDVYWKPGLDFFSPFGLNLTVVPHWNNAEGGDDLDTTHCFIGSDRFNALVDELPGPTVILGIDEHTACIVDLDARSGLVHGAGSVRILRPGDKERIYSQGESFPLDLLRAAGMPDRRTTS
jgi:cyanophycinase-like exopeptidase